MKLSDLLGMYVDVHQSSWAPATTGRARCYVATILTHISGDCNVEELKTIMLQDLVSSLNKKLAPTTVRDTVRLLRAAFDMAIDYEVLQKNPAKKLVLPKMPDHEARVLDQSEVNVLIEGVRDTDLHLPVVLALATGMRRGEILGLRWGDIVGSTVKVGRSRGSYGLKEPKTRSSRRKIAMPDWAVQEIGKISGKRSSGAYVVPEITPEAFSQKFSRRAKRLGFDGLTFHGLRHTHATLLLSRGAPIKAVSDRLGHRNANITMRVYAHTLPGQDEKAAELLDGLLA